MHALGKDVHAQGPIYEAAKARGHPKLIVVAGARIERDHEAHLAHARREGIEVCGQVIAAALLAGLDEPDAAGTRDALRVDRLDRRDRREHRISIVRAAAPIEAALLDDRSPRTEALAPPCHLGLLVQVAI